MKVLLTGASSFTGYWFAKALRAAGHEVVCTFQAASREAYSGVRRQRVESLCQHFQAEFGCSFGSSRFLAVLNDATWDVLCHHGADVKNYRSPDFNYVQALAANTRNADTVLESLAEGGCSRLVITGSVFEQGEGAGSDGLPAFSAYGLSKGLTAEVFNFLAARKGLQLGKFVVPNPFGPLEEARFTTGLVKAWARGETTEVRTPRYIRDNIHVSLLAECYRDFTEALGDGPGSSKTHPSGYISSQGEFTARFAREIGSRLGLPCEYRLLEQSDFDEPRIRTNITPADTGNVTWSESEAWDELAEYYEQMLSSATEGGTGDG